MLVLTRKTRESIVVNQNTRITVLAANSGKAKLGVEAPPEVPVHRSEVFDAIEKAESPHLDTTPWYEELVW
jgi:carbon storage regulator